MEEKEKPRHTDAQLTRASARLLPAFCPLCLS